MKCLNFYSLFFLKVLWCKEQTGLLYFSLRQVQFMPCLIIWVKKFRSPYWPQNPKHQHHRASAFLIIPFRCKNTLICSWKICLCRSVSLLFVSGLCAGKWRIFVFQRGRDKGCSWDFPYHSFTWIPNFLPLTRCLKRKLQNCLPNDLVSEKKW